MLWIDLIYWATLGGIVGFAYGWRRLAKSSTYAISAAERDPLFDERGRRTTIGYLNGRRLGTCLMTGIFGAMGGAAIWLGAYLLWLAG